MLALHRETRLTRVKFIAGSFVNYARMTKKSMRLFND